jgi:hypothetical protein
VDIDVVLVELNVENKAYHAETYHKRIFQGKQAVVNNQQLNK